MRSRLLMQHILQRDEPADQQNDERNGEPAQVFVDEGLDGLTKEIEEGGYEEEPKSSADNRRHKERRQIQLDDPRRYRKYFVG